jgi:hypothetical protein
MRCGYCGREVSDDATVCPGCGGPIKHENIPSSSDVTIQVIQQTEGGVASTTGGRDWLITLILCAAGGVWGIHRFYTGHIAMGLLELITFGGCGLLVIYDMILIVTGRFKDSQGRPLVRNITQ